MEVVRASVIFVCLLWIPVTKGLAVRRSGFEEPCNETLKCNKSAWLVCRSSSCSCLMDDMIYDKVKQKCTTKPGERCKYQVTSDGTEDSLALNLYETTDCVAHAQCDNEKTCNCEPGYYETSDESCEPQKGYNASCDSFAECLESKLLDCINGRCLCNVELNHIYGYPEVNNYQQPDQSNMKCVGMAGKELKRGAVNASCVEGTVLRGTICECAETSTEYTGTDGRCHFRKSYGDQCATDNECVYEHSYFSCVNGKCGCNNYTSYTINEYSSRRGYFDSQDRCVGLAGKPCDPPYDCVANAECNGGVCDCQYEYVETSLGYCGRQYGASCTETSPCSDSRRCTDGVCDCPQGDHQVYSHATKNCEGLVHSYCSSDVDCHQNMMCKYINETNRTQCICTQGFVENTEGKCDRAFNNTCDNSPHMCDGIAGLKCRNGLCACPDILRRFDQQQRLCLGLVGSRCTAENQCVSGAKCIKTNPRIAGSCLCDSGFAVQGDMTCVASEPESGKS